MNTSLRRGKGRDQVCIHTVKGLSVILLSVPPTKTWRCCRHRSTEQVWKENTAPLLRVGCQKSLDLLWFVPLPVGTLGLLQFSSLGSFNDLGSLMINDGGRPSKALHGSYGAHCRGQENTGANRAGSALTDLGATQPTGHCWGLVEVGISSHSMHSAHKVLLGGLAVLSPHPRGFWWAELMQLSAQLLGKLKDDQ